MPQNEYLRPNFRDHAEELQRDPVHMETERLVAAAISDKLFSPVRPTVRMTWLRLVFQLDQRGVVLPFSERTFYRRVASEARRRRREIRFARDRPGPSDTELA